MLFENKVVVITGAARGMGQAFAAAFAINGANIVIQDREGAEATAAKLGQEYYNAIGVEGDISNEKDVNIMIEAAVDAYGRIDVLINNAGIFSSLLPTPIEDISVTEFDRVMAVNVRGPFLASRAVIPVMREHGGGRIVNVASNTPLAGLPFFSHYTSSKGAVLAMTRALARELGRYNILVNAVAPGYTLSDGVLENAKQVELVREGANARRVLQRDQTPDDVVGAVLYLSGPGSAFVTGQTLCIDGGTVMN